MKILLLGGNGAVGQLALDEFLNANHDVKALVRSGSTLTRKHARLTVVQGDPTRAADLENVLAGQDAVLSTLGARTNKKTTLRTDVATRITCVMAFYEKVIKVKADVAALLIFFSDIAVSSRVACFHKSHDDTTRHLVLWRASQPADFHWRRIARQFAVGRVGE